MRGGAVAQKPSGYLKRPRLPEVEPPGCRLLQWAEEVTSGWRGKARRLKITDGHFHRLRHTAATLMLRAGVPVKNVAAMLGHSATVCADIYGHATPAGGKEAVQRLAEDLGHNKP